MASVSRPSRMSRLAAAARGAGRALDAALLLALAAGAALVLALALADAKRAVWDDAAAREKLLLSAAAAAGDLRALGALVGVADAESRRAAIARVRSHHLLAVCGGGGGGPAEHGTCGAEPAFGLAALLLAAAPALLLAGTVWLAAGRGPSQPPTPARAASEASKQSRDEGAPAAAAPRGAMTEPTEDWRLAAGPGLIGRATRPAPGPHRLVIDWGCPMYRRGRGARVHPEHAAAAFAVAGWLLWRGADLSAFEEALARLGGRAADSPDPWAYAALHLYENRRLTGPLADLVTQLAGEDGAAARAGGRLQVPAQVPKYVAVAGVMLALRVREAFPGPAAPAREPEGPASEADAAPGDAEARSLPA
ncbi:hypothetical protein Rsub_03694 [Raphidocelis subcapitata]|uniref:Uncharacterized protein n=1 Tax=Raphidocelis subcapitata TaxID=307507 RepID=A0A2V0NZ24_9CHLO|nr:hypothetical protein Rsub_03694 [Raphidocelis subcapitata]|eukprot:GBF90840.1 hypothetical protein Rsub_03694 [Raphidocelis subcapitata]